MLDQAEARASHLAHSATYSATIQFASASIERERGTVLQPRKVRMFNFACPLKDALGRRLIEVYRVLGDFEQITAEHDESGPFLEMRFVEEELRRHNEICPLCKLKSCGTVLKSETSWRGTMAG